MTPFVPIAEIMEAMDLPKRAVYNDIRAGKLPGFFRKGKPYVRRHEWEQYLRGEWQPRTNTSFVHRVTSERAA